MLFQYVQPGDAAVCDAVREHLLVAHVRVGRVDDPPEALVRWFRELARRRGERRRP